MSNYPLIYSHEYSENENFNKQNNPFNLGPLDSLFISKLSTDSKVMKKETRNFSIVYVIRNPIDEYYCQAQLQLW